MKAPINVVHTPHVHIEGNSKGSAGTVVLCLHSSDPLGDTGSGHDWPFTEAPRESKPRTP